MTKEARREANIKLVQDAVGSVESTLEGVAAAVDRLQTALRLTIPFLPFVYGTKRSERRLMFRWDGWNVQVDKPTDPPLQPVMAVHEAFEGLVEDAIETIKNYG